MVKYMNTKSEVIPHLTLCAILNLTSSIRGIRLVELDSNSIIIFLISNPRGKSSQVPKHYLGTMNTGEVDFSEVSSTIAKLSESNNYNAFRLHELRNQIELSIRENKL